MTILGEGAHVLKISPGFHNGRCIGIGQSLQPWRTGLGNIVGVCIAAGRVIVIGITLSRHETGYARCKSQEKKYLFHVN
ncbi:MAG: hypothetical protein B7Z54_01355 [Sphingobacteriales bacterium 12-47-4]|nr:MAG: hypothetical protein B7Z54_01355 [Sphingobacteriales bacterium 12-47-4]